VSVIAPLCIVAGSCSTIAMLREREGEAFLREQGLPYIAVAPDGSLHGPAIDATR
jgi:thiamine biosynthesis lipoprotein